MRVALIRGSLLRPWEVPNYVLDGAETTFFASTRQARALSGVHTAVRGLPSLAELTTRLSPRVAGAAYYFGGSAEYLLGLERALSGFDVAHAAELSTPMSLQAIRARDRGRCRRAVITVMENIAYHPYENELVRRRARRVAAGIDHAFAVTGKARLHLESAGVPPDRITVLPVGIDMERFRPAGEPGSRSGLSVLSVARLEPAKGVADLVVAVGLAHRAGHDIRVTFAGQGPLRGRLQALAAELGIADRVSFAEVGWPEVADLYRRHDAFVLASAPTGNWREQFGFAVVEAMASGLPVVAGDSGSLPEVVGDSDSLVRPHDPEALAERLIALLADPDGRAQQGRANRTRALERYDVAGVRTRIAALYTEVLARPARSAGVRTAAILGR